MSISNKDKRDFLSEDEPPSYDDVQDLSSDHVPADGTDSKRPFFRRRSSPAAGPSSMRSSSAWKPQSPANSPPTPSWYRNIIGSSASRSSEPPTPKSQAEMRNTVLSLVRDLVTSPSSSLGASLWSDGREAALGMLESCAVACERQQLSLASILQEKSVEGHTPAYWAIIQRPPSADDQSDDVLMKLLALSAPLTQHTMYEIHLACLVAPSNSLYQRIRTYASIFPLHGADSVLLRGDDASGPSKGFGDVVEVFEGGGEDVNAGAFSVKLELGLFQRRMRVSKEVHVEFIARGPSRNLPCTSSLTHMRFHALFSLGRVWRLIFFVVPPPETILSGEYGKSNNTTIPEGAYHALPLLPTPLAQGAWACCLSLAAGSPECWVDGRVVVNEPDSASRDGDTSVAESGFDERETARTDDSGLEYFDQTISSSTGDSADRISSGPDNSTGLTQYGAPGGSLPNLEPSRRASSSLPPPSPTSPSQQTSHPSSSSFSYLSSAHSTLATLPILSWVVPKPPGTPGPTQPLTLRLMCTQGPLLAPAPPPYEPLPSLLAHASVGGGGTSKKTEKKLRKEAEREAHEESAAARNGIEQRTPTIVSPGVARTAIVAGLGEGTGWLDGGGGGVGKLMYE